MGLSERYLSQHGSKESCKTGCRLLLSFIYTLHLLSFVFRSRSDYHSCVIPMHRYIQVSGMYLIACHLVTWGQWYVLLDDDLKDGDVIIVAVKFLC